MNINFKETYQSLSTAELLNIVKHANDYQREAVLAAIALLKDRTITQEDNAEARQISSDSKNSWLDYKPNLNSITTKIENLVEPIVSTDTRVTPQKWIKILVLTLSLYTVWDLITLTLRWRRFLELNSFNYSTLTEIAGPLYLAITIIGLYKTKKWAWSFLMIYFVYESTAFAYGTFVSIKYSFLKANIAGELLATLVFAGGVSLLSRSSTRTHFEINERIFRNTIFSAIILFLLFLIYIKYF